MGTHSLTYFIDPHHAGEPTACMYRQMDGHPSGHGRELAEFLAPITIVNGCGVGDAAGTHANGPGCLAAQAVAHFKNDQGVGGIYLEPTTRTARWEDYVYKVFADEETQIRVEIYRVRDPDTEYELLFSDSPIELLFSGSPTEMLAWIEASENPKE